MPHPALSADHTAVVTGGASGIGLAAAGRFAALGMNVCIADVDDARLHAAAAKLAPLAKRGEAIMTAKVDVSRRDSVVDLEAKVRQRFGAVDVLMNNAGIQPGSKMFGPEDNWQRILGVNLWGIIHGSRTYVIQNEDGQIEEPYSISAGLDYPGIGPMHANLAKQKRAIVLAVNDDEAIRAAYELTRLEGIIPALESAHALGALEKMRFKPTDVVVLTVSGRGDKDIETYLSDEL